MRVWQRFAFASLRWQKGTYGGARGTAFPV